MKAWPIFALCLLAGSRWLLEGAHPEVQTTYLTEAVGCAMAAGCAMLLSGTGNRRKLTDHSTKLLSRAGGSGSWCFASGSALALGGPAIGNFISDRNVSADNATLALALVPCVVAVASQAMGEGSSTDLPGRLWPGLAGVAGLLLLLPQPIISGWRFSIALIFMLLASGLGAVFAQGLSRPDPEEAARAWKATLPAALLSAALVFLVLASATHLLPQRINEVSLLAAAQDGLIAFLSLYALRELGPTQWSVQFLLAPLITLCEGVVFLRPVLDLRSWLAFGLLGISSVYLLNIGRASTQETSGLFA